MQVQTEVFPAKKTRIQTSPQNIFSYISSDDNPWFKPTECRVIAVFQFEIEGLNFKFQEIEKS